MTELPLRISIVIPAYNAAAVIGEQLEAISVQEGAHRLEVLICDNNSSDGTADVARRCAGDLDLRIIDAKGPSSASFGRNRGASAARGEILLFCDADDVVDRRWVAELSAPFLDGGDGVAAGSLHHQRFNDEEILAAYGIGPDPEPIYGAPEAATHPYAGYLPTVPGNNFGIRRARYLALQGMDHSFPGGAEETDFVWRAQLTGVEVVTCSSAIVHYRLRPDGRAIFRQQRIQNFARIMLWMRYRDRGMPGPSIRYSVSEVLRYFPRMVTRRSRRERLLSARVVGGNIGALQGILNFRMLRRVPRPQLMESSGRSSDA